jgi:hypothetical protein
VVEDSPLITCIIIIIIIIISSSSSISIVFINIMRFIICTLNLMLLLCSYLGGWDGQAIAHTKNMRYTYIMLVNKRQGRHVLAHVGIYGRISELF